MNTSERPKDGPSTITDVQRDMITALSKRFSRPRANSPEFDCDDLFQAGYLKAWELVVDRGSPLEDVEVYVVARNAMIALFKRAKVEREKRSRAALEPSFTDAGFDPLDADSLDARESLQLLTEVERDVVHRRYWLRQRDPEIAESLGVTDHAVQRKAASAFVKIRAWLGEAYADGYLKKHPRRYKASRINEYRFGNVRADARPSRRVDKSA